MPSLIQAVLAHSPEMHEDHVNLACALREAKTMVDLIIDEVKKMEDVAKVAYYDSHMVYPKDTPPFKLSQPGRCFVREVSIDARRAE